MSHVSNAQRVRDLARIVAALVRRQGGEVRLTSDELEWRGDMGMTVEPDGVLLVIGDEVET